MSDLSAQALRLIFKIDELLEPLEENSNLSRAERASVPKLRKILERAEKRYYRRRVITKPGQFSMVAAIVDKHKEPEPEKIEIKVATGRHPLTYWY